MSLPNFCLNPLKLCIPQYPLARISRNLLKSSVTNHFLLFVVNPVPTGLKLCLNPASSCTGRDSGHQSLFSLFTTLAVWVGPFHILQSNFYSWLKSFSLDIYSFCRSHSVAQYPFSPSLNLLHLYHFISQMKRWKLHENLHSDIEMCSSVP